MFGRFTAAILRYRRTTYGVLAVLLLAVSAGIVFLKADFRVEAFFGSDDPETTYLAGYRDRWDSADLLMVVADGGEQSLLDRERMGALDALATDLEGIEGVEGVMSVTRVPRVRRGGPAGTFIPVPLIASIPPADAPEERMEAFREGLLNDATLVPSYLSADGRYATILVRLGVDAGDLSAVQPVVQRVTDHVLGQGIPGVTFHMGGVPAIRADVLSVIVRDQLVAVPIAALLMGTLLLLLFRSKHGVLIPGLAAGIPNLLLLGIMGWTGEPFGLLNQVFLALVPAIAVADAVHLVSRFHEEGAATAASGDSLRTDERGPIARTMAVMGVACFLTTFTTVVGFLSLVTTDMPVLRNFGIYAAIGVTMAYLTVLLIVPLALTMTKPGARRLPVGREGVLGSILHGCVVLTTRHAGLTLLGAGTFAVFAVWAGTLVVTDWKVTESFNEDHPVSVANRIVDEHLGGVLSMELDLVGPPGVFDDPEVLALLDERERAVLEIDKVRAAVGPGTLLRTTSRLIGGPDKVPESEGTVRRLYELGDRSGMVSSFVKPERDRARVIVRASDLGAVGFLALGSQLEERFSTALADHDVEVHLTGDTFVSSRGIHTVTRDLRNSLISAFAIIGLIIAVLFRSVRFGVLSLVPNSLPLVVGYGMMGLMGWELEPARAVVFTIALGVSVDSAIHVLARFSEERQAGLSVDAAIESAVLHSGRAITITALILLVGFAANINSASPNNAAFGRLGSVIIAAAILSNLIVLPALLKVGFGGSSVERARKMSS